MAIAVADRARELADRSWVVTAFQGNKTAKFGWHSSPINDQPDEEIDPVQGMIGG